MAKSLGKSKLVQQIEELEKKSRLLDVVMQALPVEQRVWLFHELSGACSLSPVILRRRLDLSSFDISPVIPTLATPCVIRIKGAGYLQEGDGQNFLKSSNKATRYIDQKSLASAVQELKDDWWDTDAIEVKSVDKV